MSMTTNDQQHADKQQTKDEAETYTLFVTAEVEIIDQSGTVVPTRTMAGAIRSIRSRFHEDIPLVGLAQEHQHDPLFAHALQGWLVTATGILPIDGENQVQEPHYRLRYHSFTLSDPTAAGSSQTPCQPEALVPVAMKAADAAGVPVKLSSQLLGFTRPLLHPGDSAQEQTRTRQQDASILDGLDPDLFTGPASGQLILVHPPAPLRHENTVTIPDATGVVYNANPGDYPIDGEGVSVKAQPAEGYRFPETATVHWDYEHAPQPETFTQTPVLGGLADLVEETDHEVSAGEDPEDPDPDAAAPTGAHEPSQAVVLRAAGDQPWWKQRATIRYGAAALGVVLVAGLLLLLLGPGSDNASETETTPEGQSDWVSSVALPTPAEEALTEDHSITLWDIDADQAAELSWYAAGVAHIDADEDALVLRSTLSGDETARVELDEPVEWTSEFTAGEDPAVGARTESSFLAITAEGETASWAIESDDSLQISGSTPMLTTDEGEIYALIIGEDEPVPVEANPEYSPAAIDDETLIQFTAGMPRVATLPMSAEEEADELRLEPPTVGSSFGRHLSVGHGFTLTEWTVEDQDYLVVHSLEDGTVTAAVPSIAAAAGWSIGRGMDLAIIGPYAFDLDTGELVAESDSGDFVSALGDAAISQGEDGREFILDGQAYFETSRVIGYTGGGTIIIRQPDGSVAALSEFSGTA